MVRSNLRSCRYLYYKIIGYSYTTFIIKIYTNFFVIIMTKSFRLFLMINKTKLITKTMITQAHALEIY